MCDHAVEHRSRPVCMLSEAQALPRKVGKAYYPCLKQVHKTISGVTLVMVTPVRAKRVYDDLNAEAGKKQYGHCSGGASP